MDLGVEGVDEGVDVLFDRGLGHWEVGKGLCIDEIYNDFGCFIFVNTGLNGISLFSKFFDEFIQINSIKIF